MSEGDKNLYILDTGSGERREIEDDAYRVVAGNLSITEYLQIPLMPRAVSDSSYAMKTVTLWRHA